MDRNASKKSRKNKQAQDVMTDLNQDDQTLHTTTSDVEIDATTDAVTTDDAILLGTSSETLDTTGTVETEAVTETVDLEDKDLSFTLAEEQLKADVYETQIGTVAISKRTEVLPVEGAIDVQHDEVKIEHKEVNEPVADAEQPWYEGDTLVVPVYEEVLVTEKRLYLKEEIRITRIKETEQVTVRDTVRRQVIDVSSDVDRLVDDETSTNR